MKRLRRPSSPVALLALVFAGPAAAFSGGDFSPSGTPCGACHMGGADPAVSFSTGPDAGKPASTVTVTAGQSTQVLMRVNVPAGFGVAAKLLAPDGLKIEAGRADMREEGNVLSHAGTLDSVKGRVEIPFVLSAPAEAACPATLPVHAQVTAVDGDHGPTGDGFVSMTLNVKVACRPARAPVPARPDASPNRAIQKP